MEPPDVTIIHAEQFITITGAGEADDDFIMSRAHNVSKIHYTTLYCYTTAELWTDIYLHLHFTRAEKHLYLELCSDEKTLDKMLIYTLITRYIVPDYDG